MESNDCVTFGMVLLIDHYLSQKAEGCAYKLLGDSKEFATPFFCAKIYRLDKERWVILDYLRIPDAPRHYIDCIEGDICNMNVRIISNETKTTVENSLGVFE